MDINKAQWVTDGDSMRMSMPFAKVDEERRLVSGWATLNSVDTQGDVVTAEASANAFAKFRGNIREMHQPIAAGKMVDFKQDTFFDPETQKFYDGIFVTARVSKGAQGTWEKVLDGTLSGFSIGGGLKKSRNEFDDSLKKSVRVIDEYEITELSLVDNPANQMANVVSIHKMADGTTVLEGMAAETTVENVFWCREDELAKTANESTATCSICDTPMENIGWFESDSEDRVSKIASFVRKFASKNNTSKMGTEMVVNVDIPAGVDPETVRTAIQSMYKGNGGVVKMADENANPVSDDDKPGLDEATNAIEEGAPVEEAVATETPADEEVVATEEVVDEPDFEKMFSELKEAFTKGLDSVKAGHTEELEAVRGNLEEISKSFETKFGEVESKITALNSQVESLVGTVGSVEKRIDGVESDTAIKKSGDVESSETTLTKSRESKSLWSGTFFGGLE